MKITPLARALVTVVVMAGSSGAVSGNKLYKWVDEQGRTHYTETLPPEHKDKASTEIDKRGRVLRKNDVVVEQPRPSEEDAARQRAEEKRLQEQKRRDTALLKTYTSEAEIDLARDRSLALPQQVFSSYEPRIKAARQRADGLRAQIQQLLKAGKPVSQPLKEDVAAADRDVASLEAERNAKQAEIDQIREKYAGDKSRYRELIASGASAATARNP